MANVKSFFVKNATVLIVVGVVILGAVWFLGGKEKTTELKLWLYNEDGEIIIPSSAQAFIAEDLTSNVAFISFDVVGTNPGTEVPIDDVGLVLNNLAATGPLQLDASFVDPDRSKLSTLGISGGFDTWYGGLISVTGAGNPLVDDDGVCDESINFCATLAGTYVSGGSDVPISGQDCLPLTICADGCYPGGGEPGDGTFAGDCSIVTEGMKCSVVGNGEGTLVWDQTCCVDPAYTWDVGLGECVLVTCQAGTLLPGECDPSNNGNVCAPDGSMDPGCGTCGCSGLQDGNGNDYVCNAGSGICEPPVFAANFVVSVSR